MSCVDDDEKIVCDWCGDEDAPHTDTDRWACDSCAEEYGLNLDNPGVNGFRRWTR